MPKPRAVDQAASPTLPGFGTVASGGTADHALGQLALWLAEVAAEAAVANRARDAAIPPLAPVLAACEGEEPSV